MHNMQPVVTDVACLTYWKALGGSAVVYTANGII